MKKIVLVILGLLFCANVFAHGGHPDEGTVFSQIGIPIQARQAREFSLYVVVQAVQAGRLDDTWMDARIVDMKQIDDKESKDWIVAINNPQEKIAEKRTIFIYLDEYGNPFNINFTGE